MNGSNCLLAVVLYCSTPGFVYQWSWWQLPETHGMLLWDGGIVRTDCCKPYCDASKWRIGILIFLFRIKRWDVGQLALSETGLCLLAYKPVSDKYHLISLELHWSIWTMFTHGSLLMLLWASERRLCYHDEEWIHLNRVRCKIVDNRL